MESTNELNQYISYKEALESARESQSSDTFFNDSAIHEEFVLNELFVNATKLLPFNKAVFMYCGKMYSFRDEMKGIIEQKKTEFKQKIEKKEKGWENSKIKEFDPYNNLINSVENYFSLGGELHVIVDEDIEKIAEESIWKDHFEKNYNKRFKIYRIKTNGVIGHFALSGNAYRMEISHKDKTAICCFNNKEYAELLNSNFNSLLRMSQSIDNLC